MQNTRKRPSVGKNRNTNLVLVVFYIEIDVCPRTCVQVIDIGSNDCTSETARVVTSDRFIQRA